MATVIIPFDSRKIQTRMREMRLWLDAKSIQPSLFTYDAQAHEPIARIAFRDQKHAEAFATQFAGKMI